jgi:hypothetical protein
MFGIVGHTPECPTETCSENLKRVSLKKLETMGTDRYHDSDRWRSVHRQLKILNKD